MDPHPPGSSCIGVFVCFSPSGRGAQGSASPRLHGITSLAPTGTKMNVPCQLMSCVLVRALVPTCMFIQGGRPNTKVLLSSHRGGISIQLFSQNRRSHLLNFVYILLTVGFTDGALRVTPGGGIFLGTRCYGNNTFAFGWPP